MVAVVFLKFLMGQKDEKLGQKILRAFLIQKGVTSKSRVVKEILGLVRAWKLRSAIKIVGPTRIAKVQIIRKNIICSLSLGKVGTVILKFAMKKEKCFRSYDNITG